jgi:hypothetical protein
VRGKHNRKRVHAPRHGDNGIISQAKQDEPKTTQAFQPRP